MSNITAFSYSRYETWAQCPRKAYYQYVERLPTGPKSDAMARGIDIHEACAEIYRGRWSDHPGLNIEWKNVLGKHKSFYGSDLEAELQLAFDKDWNRTPWFDKQTMYRVAFDGMAYTPAREGVLQIYEHKTGKKRAEQHFQQAGWYAGVATLVVPDATTINVDIHYLDLPAANITSVIRGIYPKVVAVGLLNQWREKAKEMMSDEEFPTRAGYHCRWCPYADSVGGPCHLG